MSIVAHAAPKDPNRSEPCGAVLPFRGLGVASGNWRLGIEDWGLEIRDH